MGIGYMVALDCAAKAALSIDTIAAMLTSRRKAQLVLALARNGGDSRPPEDITVQVQVTRGGTVEQTSVSVKSLLDQAAPLDAHRAGCLTCPVNRDLDAGYGCHDTISYPIEAETERWLLACLPDSLESPEGYLFKSALADFAWDGARAAAMRTQGETFFRLRTAPTRTWPSGVSVSGDQVFHMLFHVGTVGASHALMVGVFFGVLALGDAAGGRPAPETANAQQMARFLHVLARAAGLRLDVLIEG